MDIKKAQKFNAKMGRQKFSKGGMIRHVAGRKYFDDGGIATNTIAPTTGATGGAVPTGSGLNNNGLANAIGAGNSFTAGAANIASGTNAQQLGNAYTGANNAINAQVGLANTLNPQAQQGVNSQNALAAQELAMSQGQGPNPAAAQLAQQANTNVNNQAALMAGQRGASADVGELARQAAQTGAATQQQAVGQAATQEANQQIAAQGNLANLAGNQISQAGQAVGNLSSAQQNEQNILQGANTSYNNAAVGMQSNINNVNAQTAAGNQAANQGIISSVANAIPGVGSIVGKLFAKGGEVGKDEHLMLAEMNAHSMNHAKMFASGGQSNLGTTSFNPIDSGGAPVGVQQTPSFGTQAQAQANQNTADAFNGLGQNTADAFTQSQDESALNSLVKENDAEDLADAGTGIKAGNQIMEAHGGKIHGIQHFHSYFADGGMSKKVPAMVSPGERYLNPDEVKQVVEHGANPLKIGKKILGKPRVKGDSLKNDIVPMDLDDGGVVLPRHVSTKKNPEKAELFVRRAVHMKSPKKG